MTTREIYESSNTNIPEGATGMRSCDGFTEFFSGSAMDGWRLIYSNAPDVDSIPASKSVIEIAKQEKPKCGMTTYKSYEEAKIANPDQDIYLDESIFRTWRYDQIKSGTKCNPADHCMTVEKFLADGHKLVEGDFIIQHTGSVERVCDDPDWNMKEHRDNIRYILRAAALEEKPKPTKFVKVEESIFDLKEEFERGELYMRLSNDYLVVPNETQLSILLDHKQCYRQVEIDWTDELGSFLAKKAFNGASVNNLDISDLNDNLGTVSANIELRFNDFVEMCHLVSSLTEKPTN